MGGPARLWAMLAVAAATPVAAASDRFVPGDANFVVADVRETLPDANLRGLLTDFRANPGVEGAAVPLAAAFIERARRLRQPGYFGRAEAVLAPHATKAGAGAGARRLYAEVLQFRHDFPAAEALLDSLLRESPHDADARSMRASIRLVRGNFSGARADCAQLAASRGDHSSIGFACLAESLAGGGQLDRALALLASQPETFVSADPAARAYLLATRAELRERNRDAEGAIRDYRAALKLAPQDDSIRAALADALAARGRIVEARESLSIANPGLALVVRSAALASGSERAEYTLRARASLELEASRGDSMHYREAAMLALSADSPATALEAARRNFELQKELPDVRVLARAALAARDAAALQSLERWLRATGYRDSVTESILGAAPRS
jgi:Flp pilus assembly protein TadD